MPLSEYSPLVIQHFERPYGQGLLQPAVDVVLASTGRAEQGTAFCLSARIAGDQVTELRFAAYGCPHCIAAVSWTCEHLASGTLVDLENWRWQFAGAALQVPVDKRGRLLLLEDAVRQLAREGRKLS